MQTLINVSKYDRVGNSNPEKLNRDNNKPSLALPVPYLTSPHMLLYKGDC